MPIVMAAGRSLIAAYDGDPGRGLVIGHAKLGLHGRWRVQVGAKVKYRRRRRSAMRALHRLCAAALVDVALGRAALARRPGVAA